jgi:hypothetical protein
LQHASWLQWARKREPLLSLERGAGALSKKKLLLLFPQVRLSSVTRQCTRATRCVSRDMQASVRSLLPAPAPPFANVDLHGWFQFHTSCYISVSPLPALEFEP